MESIRRTRGDEIAKRQLEELPSKVTRDFEDFYKNRAEGTSKTRDDLLIMTADGKGIVMTKDGLREATRRAADNETRCSGIVKTDTFFDTSVSLRCAVKPLDLSERTSTNY